jgi:hypothetical protein
MVLKLARRVRQRYCVGAVLVSTPIDTFVTCQSIVGAAERRNVDHYRRWYRELSGHRSRFSWLAFITTTTDSRSQQQCEGKLQRRPGFHGVH